MNISQALRDKSKPIIQDWIKSVEQEATIQSSHDLSRKSMLDSLPGLLRTMAQCLDQPAADLHQLAETGIEHGNHRAQQGFNADEVATEYRLLRQVILSHLEADLLQLSQVQLLSSVRKIDLLLDIVIGQCFKCYADNRLQELDDIRGQLLLTNQELDRLITSQQEDIVHLAHDLKSPLTAIIGFSDLFLRQQRQSEQASDSPQNLRSIEQVVSNARRLLHIINDALELTRYRSGKLKLNPAPNSIALLLHEVIAALEPLAQRKNLELQVNNLFPEQAVWIDALRFQQLLTNLVSNAIRYTESGSVTVTCKQRREEQILVTVTDTGIGIAAAEQGRIFEPYYRGEYALRLPDSTGLGLAIVAQVVELLQGQIAVQSVPDQGTTFTVELPLQWAE